MKILVNAKELGNKMMCDKCGSLMNLVQRNDGGDSLRWACRNNKSRCSFKSIRHSFFEKSNISLSLLLLYIWVNDFDKKHIVKELDLNKQTVVDWLNMCREICQNYCHNQEQLGGHGKYIEIDESCVAKQKHHRGRPRVGATQWVFGGIERGEGGLAFAVRVAAEQRRRYIQSSVIISCPALQL